MGMKVRNAPRVDHSESETVISSYKDSLTVKARVNIDAMTVVEPLERP